MTISIFWIPASQPAAALAELNRFLQSHRVIGVERHFVADGARSAWALAVDYVEEPVAGVAAASSGKQPKVDYRERLDPETFARFAALRALRKQLAEAEGVPAYAIVTNEQMAQIAQLRPTSLEALRGVAGVGESRIRKYGRALLESLALAEIAPVRAAAPNGAASERE